MAIFVVGDYKYTVIDLENKYVRAEAYDKTLTTYSDIESTVTYEDEEYTVTDISYCFYECVNLTVAPSHLPNTITTMRSCFESCTSLTQTPQNCPTNVTNMENCFYNCTSLQTVDNNFHLRSGNLRRCFYNCENLLYAPDIPSNSAVMECFKYCDQLNGNIIVSAINSSPAAEQMFIGTTKDIYILGSDSIADNWRLIADEYKNVHYEADDHPAPQPSLTAIRTNEDGEPDSSGEWILITKGYYLSQDYLPSGWNPQATDEKIIKDGDEQQQILVPPGSPIELPIFHIGEEPHSFTYSLSDGYKKSSITVNIARTMALLDFQGKKGSIYNDIPGMGMAIGKRAERNGLDIRFPTVIGEGLVPATRFEYDAVENPTGNPSEQGWYEEVSEEVYILTEDTTAISGKTYYTQREGSEYIDLGNYQLIVGKYNKQNSDATFIVGNGTNENNPSNIMEVGDEIVLGRSDGTQSFVRMDYHSMQMFDRENASRSDGVPYFWISDLRNKDGIYHIEESVVFRSSYPSTIKINLATAAIINDNYIVTVNDVVWVNVEKNTRYIKFSSNDLPPDDSTVKISYDSSSSSMKAYTLGTRRKNSFVAPFSYAVGVGATASGYCSHAEGYNTTASGGDSHAEGYGTTASGWFSHAEGYDTTASGDYAHAQNMGTIAAKYYQTAIGKYNKEDKETYESKQKAFIIGNGEDENERSNAFDVDWSGNVRAAGKFYQNGSELLALPETGTTTAGSVTWKYKKYTDGSLEMWGSGNTTLAISTPSGNLFTTANEYNIAMPSFVDAIDFITAELSGAGWADITGFSVPPKLRLYAPTSFGSANRTLRYYLRGTWS